MKNALCLIPFLLFGLTGRMQTVIDLYATMSGFHLMDNNQPVPIWGYGYIGDPFISLPSPLLRFNQGDDVVISMFNDSQEDHTIHLHGLDVDQANDGVPHTSFSILPQETAAYSFNATHPGNYLYHCHVTTTLHLTMGMYGMIVVDYSENQLYEDGPLFDRSYEFLFSDLEVETNSDITTAFPFNEIRPDYFMINGKAGEMLTANEDEFIHYAEGEEVLLRLGNMAYSLVKVIFPEEVTALVHTSDGRTLPEPFAADTLELYPGERFSVICQVESGFDGLMEVQYESMVNKTLDGSNQLQWSPGIPDNVAEQNIEQWKVYPNPTNSITTVDFSGKSPEFLRLFDLNGRMLQEWRANSSQQSRMRLDLSNYPQGVYLLQDDYGLGKMIMIGG